MTDANFGSSRMQHDISRIHQDPDVLLIALICVLRHLRKFDFFTNSRRIWKTDSDRRPEMRHPHPHEDHSHIYQVDSALAQFQESFRWVRVLNFTILKCEFILKLTLLDNASPPNLTIIRIIHYACSWIRVFDLSRVFDLRLRGIHIPKHFPGPLRCAWACKL